MKYIITLLIFMTSISNCFSQPRPLPRVGVVHDFVWTKDEDIPVLIKALKDAGAEAVRMPMHRSYLNAARAS